MGDATGVLALHCPALQCTALFLELGWFLGIGTVLLDSDCRFLGVLLEFLAAPQFRASWIRAEDGRRNFDRAAGTSGVQQYSSRGSSVLESLFCRRAVVPQ